MYMLGIETSVNGEELLVEVDHTGVYILAIGLLRSKEEVEMVARVEGLQLVLKLGQQHVESADEIERTLVTGLLDELVMVVGGIEKLILSLDVLVGLLIHVCILNYTLLLIMLQS